MSDAQADVIINFMGNHTCLAFNKSLGCNPKAVKTRLWNDLNDLVNSTPGPSKTVDQIQSVSIIALMDCL